MEEIWKTSVNELLTIFRGALTSILPWIEKAKIEWKEGESYDDWDNIASSLYNNIVCSSLMGEVLDEYSIAEYSFVYENYSDIDFILVMSNNYKNNILAFVSFQSIVSPFDCVEVAMLDNSLEIVEHLTLKLDNLEFAFMKKNNATRAIISDIEVLL